MCVGLSCSGLVTSGRRLGVIDHMSTSVLGSCSTLQDGVHHVEHSSEEAALLRELQELAGWNMMFLECC